MYLTFVLTRFILVAALTLSSCPQERLVRRRSELCPPCACVNLASRLLMWCILGLFVQHRRVETRQVTTAPTTTGGNLRRKISTALDPRGAIQVGNILRWRFCRVASMSGRSVAGVSLEIVGCSKCVMENVALIQTVYSEK